MQARQCRAFSNNIKVVRILSDVICSAYPPKVNTIKRPLFLLAHLDVIYSIPCPMQTKLLLDSIINRIKNALYTVRLSAWSIRRNYCRQPG
ncbi:hypothetical protein DNU24_07155 [Salmonella enterica subsp. salamae]|uniref:Uncharacterized protein n=1 Tax=Salmonella enterica subsp. salamae TaxID=59202 RepID=A0A5Y3X8B5_SALER|nr:hypothetical protein [Salmonella enterica subsp. salamae]